MSELTPTSVSGDKCQLFQPNLPEVRQNYTTLLERLVSLLRAQLSSNLTSVYLLGSPGRGYATLVKQNGHWQIANDLDLAVVLHQCIGKDRLLDLMQKGTSLANPDSEYVRDTFSMPDFHVDITQFAEAELPGLPPTLFAADFAYGGCLLDGPECRQAVRFGLESIPLLEAYLLLYNRLCSMIETVEAEQFLAQRGVKSQAWTNTLYFAKKMLLDAGSAVLIARSSYSPDFRTRVRRLSESHPEMAGRYSDWIDRWAVIDPEMLDGETLRTVWADAYEAFLTAREEIGLMPLDTPMGSLSWRTVARWHVATIAAEWSHSRCSRRRHVWRPAGAAVHLARALKPLHGRLQAYRSAERLASQWLGSLWMSPRGSDSSRWLEQRRSTIRTWKTGNWA